MLHFPAPVLVFTKLEVNRGVLGPVTKPAVTRADSISGESLLDAGWGLGEGLNVWMEACEAEKRENNKLSIWESICTRPTHHNS